MEAELVTVGTTQKGLISSVLSYEYIRFDRSNENENDEVTQSENEVLVSLCPSGRVLAIVTRSCKAQFLVHEEEEQSLVMYHNTFQGVLDVPRDLMNPKPRFVATALTIFPIEFSRNEKVQKASVITIGFSDGCVRGYSKSGQTIFSQLFHNDAVAKISFMNNTSFSLKKHSNQEALVILYCGILCIVEGWSVVEVIQSNVAKMNKGIGWNEYDDDIPQLVYRKYHLKEQTMFNDVALLAHSTCSNYDYLCEASSVTGFEASIRSTPKSEARVITVGKHPMVALYKISKDAGQVNVSEVMHAVASKMKSAVLGKISQAGGWLGWGSQQQQTVSKPKTVDEKIHHSVDLPMDSNIPDDRRSILSITISPLGNLAVLVDCFGRVLLLECETLTIRRMWKGYREAQCGWLLASEESTKSKRPRLKGAHPQKGTNKMSQCLYIYAVRRGLLELWPTQYGKRLAAFQIGKGCRLLYSHHGVFSSIERQLSESGDLANFNPIYKLLPDGVKNTTLILSPDNILFTVSIPFPSLLWLDDPISCDAHLLKKLPQLIKLGDFEQVIQVITEMRSTKALKQAIDKLIKLYPIPQAPPQFIIQIINTAITKINHTVNHDVELLHRYLLGCRQLVILRLALDKLHAEKSHSHSTSPFHELFDIPDELALCISNSLKKYYKGFVSPKRVVNHLDLNDLIKTFILPSEVGDHLLSNTVDLTNDSEISSEIVRLVPKDESESCLLDLGCSIFLPFLKAFKSGEDVTTTLEKVGIPKRILMLSFCHVFLHGKIIEKDVDVLHQQLYDIFNSLLKIKDKESEQNPWLGIYRLCAMTSNVGHAFSMVLLHQKVCYKSEKNELDADEEEWESVTTERGHWVTLYNTLEALLYLCNVVGVKALRKLPSIPFADIPENYEGTRCDFIADLGNLQLSLFDKAFKSSSMCASALRNGGPCLIAHSLSEWIVEKKLPATIVVQMPISVTDQKESHSGSIVQLNPLLKMLPSSLSHTCLLVHCAWQAAYAKNEYTLSLQYISQLSSAQTISGIVGLLWYLKFENIIVRVIENKKRGITIDQEMMELISVCRILFGYIFQFQTSLKEHTPGDFDASRDSIVLQPQNRIVLMDIVENFPYLTPTVLRTCLELLILSEISLQFEKSINVMSFFPNWLRNSLKKSIYKSAWQEQVPMQLQQKRSKFLSEAVTVHLEKQSQPLVSSAPTCQILSKTPPDDICVDITEFQDFIFVLSQLWKLDLDVIKSYWVCNLFAGGLIDLGKRIFLTINNKSDVLFNLLSLSGYLTDQLLHNIDEKSAKLALLAQTPPTLLEWMRKQGSSPAVKNCKRIQPLWKSASFLIALIIPYLSQNQSFKDKATQLEKLIRLLKQ